MITVLVIAESADNCIKTVILILLIFYLFRKRSCSLKQDSCTLLLSRCCVIVKLLVCFLELLIVQRMTVMQYFVQGITLNTNSSVCSYVFVFVSVTLLIFYNSFVISFIKKNALVG